MPPELCEHTVIGDVCDAKYKGLLELSLNYCAYFSLVQRRCVDLEASAHRVFSHLKSAIVSEQETSEWPGTRLIDDTAVMRVYVLNSVTEVVLATEASSLFDWIQPSLPEDLCLRRADMSPWLVTISHEHDAYFVTNSDEIEMIRRLGIRVERDLGTEDAGGGEQPCAAP